MQRNFINGRCGPMAAIGVDLIASFGRVENNEITPCEATGAAASTMQMHGIRQMNTISANEPDLHSNTIDGGRLPIAYTGGAVSILAGTDGHRRPIGLVAAVGQEIARNHRLIGDSVEEQDEALVDPVWLSVAVSEPASEGRRGAPRRRAGTCRIRGSRGLQGAPEVRARGGSGEGR